MRIAFIGLGQMGAPMAQNLVSAGHDVIGYDLATPATPPCTLAERLEDVIIGAEMILTMLPHGAAITEVSEALLPHIAKGTIWCDCSTIDIASARALHEATAAKGIPCLDAPVSGGISGAEAGTLTFMIGGSDAAVSAARPVLEVMGGKLVHCGEAGAGQAAKLCNNMILGITMIGTCEAFILADQLGLSRQALYDVVSTSSGQSWSLTTYCPAPDIGPNSPADRDYQSGFSAALMAKDLTLAMQAADETETPAALGALAHKLYQEFASDEAMAGKDFSAMLPHLQSLIRDR